MPATADPQDSAAEIGLHHLPDDIPGIARRRRGRGFSYEHEGGATVSRADRERIAALVIPPAWTDVWISPDPLGHLQATGRDDRGRKQYRYHDDWRVVRDQDKFDQLGDFGAALTSIRPAAEHDLRSRGMPTRKVLALVVRLLDLTLVRIGNDVYADDNETYGLTTLLGEHASVSGSSVTFRFVGKSGSEQEVSFRDRRLAQLVEACRDLDGPQLFVHDESAEPTAVTADEVNGYLREVGGPDVTARDFRTWGGTATVTEALGPLDPPDDESVGAQLVLDAIDQAAARLGNSRAVCRESYIHPAVPAAFLEGTLAETWKRARRTKTHTRAERTVLATLDGSSSG
jgi:DNA topoisomerase-1